MEKYLRIALVTIAVLFVVWVVFGVFTRDVGATVLPKVDVCHNGHTINVAAVAAAFHLQHHDGDYLGACEEEPVDVCNNLEGDQETTPEGYVNNDGYCYVPEVPKDYCDTLDGVQAEDEDCPPVVEPTCEELQNCPVEETPPTGTQDSERPKLKVSQGPNGVKGDGTCQLEWKEINGSKKVEIRYANDGIFGNGYQSFKTDDDGAQWINGITGDNALVKFRGRSDKTEWSKAINLDC